MQKQGKTNNKQQKSANPPKKKSQERKKEENKKLVNNFEAKQTGFTNNTKKTPITETSKEPPKVIKSILKKPKTDEFNNTSELSRSLIGKSVQLENQKNLKRSEITDRNLSSSTPISVVTAYQQLNQQHLSTQTVDSAFEEYLKVQEELAARGEIDESIKNLQEGLNERLGLYPSKDKGVWLISKLLAEIGIRLAVRNLNSDKLDKANQYLKLARKHTEPLPNSDWNENQEWIKEEWEKALDCFKVALKLEKDLKENSSNTSLTCAVILSKLNKYAESIDHAQNCMNTIEQLMGIDRNKPLAEYKLFGGDAGKVADYDKSMTTYAISLHLLGKNLANLKYIKEAKVFLSKAQYVAINMLVKPKQDLQLAISNDLNNINKNYKQSLASNKKSTFDDIENSLITIKTNLANSSYSQADQQEQKALVGTITNGPPVRTVKKEDQQNKGKKGKRGQVQEQKEEDEENQDGDKVYDFVKRFADDKRKKDNQALDDYHRRIQQDFDDKQREFMQKQQDQKFSKTDAIPPKSGTIKVRERKPISSSIKSLAEPKNKTRSSRSLGATGPQVDLAKEEAEKKARIKKAQINPAAEGAKLDRKGIRYSSEKGNKNFFDKRKQNIERVNERLGLGNMGELSDEEMTELKGGTGNEEENKKFDVSLPQIKGYKLDSLNLGSAGERVLQKYEGYQSDQTEQAKSSRLFNMQDPSQRKLLQAIEGQYRKQLPSSVKKGYQEDDEQSDDLERETQDINGRGVDGSIKQIPKYIPPENTKKTNDWRDQIRNSSDDELPDAKKVISDLNKLQTLNQSDNPQLKLSIFEGDQTQYEEIKKEPEQNDFQEASNNKKPQEKLKNQRTTIFNKPPKATVPSAIVPAKKKPAEELSRDQLDLKQKLTGSIGRSLGMTSKGSPRNTDRDTTQNQSSLQNQTQTPSKDSTTKWSRVGQRGKQIGGQSKSQPSQSKKSDQYQSPAQKRKPRADIPWGGPDSDEKRIKRIQNDERLNQLAQPKPKQYVLVKEDEDEQEEDVKLQEFIEKIKKGKDINFSDYVNDISKSGQKDQFNTKITNKSGLFSKFGEGTKQNKESGEVRYIQDKKIKKSGKSPQSHSQTHLRGRNTISDIPDFLRKAHGLLDDDGDLNNQDKKRMKNLMSQALQYKGKTSKNLGEMPGLRSLLSKKKSQLNIQGGNGNLSLKELRQMEFAAAQYIQKIVRAYFCRKWFLNFKVRRRLGVPFSGLEFNQYPFMRLFDRPNVLIHESSAIPPSIVEAVQNQSQQRNLLQKKIKHGGQALRKKKELFDDPDLEQVEDNGQQINEDENDQQQQSLVVVPRRIPKGATPQQLLDNLQKNFLAKGLDAYPQFIQIGTGIDHDENGKPMKASTKNLKKKFQNDKIEIEEDFVQEVIPKIPKWRELKESDDINAFLDIKEIEQYLQRIRKAKSSKKQEEHEEKLKEKTQVKQDFVSSLAAMAQMHGVFNKSSQQKANDQPKVEVEEEDDIKTLLNKRRQVDEDEEYFPVEKYQDFSREAIVFYKKIGDSYMKWTVYVGLAFKKDKKFYIPVKILGEPLKSRSTIVTYLMNLELLKISKDIDKNFEFETVWPFILYLFNNWVRHQVKLMGLVEARPELKEVFVKSEANMYDVQQFDKSIAKVKDEYDDILNFSSEIEFDDRFDKEKHESLFKPSMLDKTKPKEDRLNPIQQLNQNKKELFNAYRKQKINMYEQLMMQEDDDNALQNFDENGKPKKKVRIQLEDEFQPFETRKQNPFEYFLKMHFVSLPRTDIGQYKLMQNLQALGYAEVLKNQGLYEENMALMNEERRKRKGLPPLSILDYNCIDRAALKLKTIIDCLYPRRQLNGWCLIPRDIKESLMAKEWQLRKQKNIQIASKMRDVSPQLLKLFGLHVDLPKQYNEKAIQFQESMKKINEFKNRKQIQIADVDENEEGDNEEDQIEPFNNNKELNDEVLMSSSRQDLRSSYQSKIIEKSISNSKKAIQKSKGQFEKEQKELVQSTKQINEQQDAIGKLMDIQKTNKEVEDYIREQEILEQGTLKIEDNSYILTLIFRKINSNYQNMRNLIDERVRRFTKESDDEEEDELKPERMKSRPCDFVSQHPDVIRYDNKNFNQIKEMEKLDIEQEKFTKKRTFFKSYAEIKICSKISTTNWDDSFNINWELLEEFFLKFRIKWNPKDFLSRRKFRSQERFTFYNFFSEFLFIQDCRVLIDINKFNVDAFKFDHIYLNLEQIKKEKEQHKLYFYYDDYLEPEFEESKFDYPVFPFYEDPRLVEDRMIIDSENIYYNYEPTKEDQMGQSATIQIVEGKNKPDLLIDENTKAYIKDPNNNFNLTLSNFPQSDGIYLGKIMICGQEGFKNSFNLRIDYYVLGYVPILQIKAFNTIYSEVFDLKLNHKKTIKDVIRICNQSSMQMVVNQLQSMMSINRKLNGNYLKLNFNIRRDKNINHGQNYINMLICNENLLRSMQKDNYRQFQGIVFFENFGGRMLVTVTEFEIEVEQLSLDKANIQMIHGNKHLTGHQLKQQQNGIQNRNLLLPKKRFQKVKMWKINIFNIFNSKNYDAVVSYQDLVNYYESELFLFYQKNPNLIKPNLVYLLQDYIRNLFIFRSRVGSILFWKLPYFRRPLDESGQHKAVSGDQLYQLKLLNVYLMLQKRLDEQNKDEDSNALPFSLDQMKAKKHSREPPSLSLRNKLIVEKELPIYSAEDTRILKLTSSNQEIIVQIPKVFKSLQTIQYCIITVTLYPLMECWIWQIYFLKTQRTFSITFYPSDLFNMDHDLLNYSSLHQAKNPAAGLWIELIKRSDLLQNPSGDILLVCESFREPLKEILFQDHVFNENASDIFFMEVTFKSYSNYVTDVRYSFYPLDLETDEINEYTVSIRAFSLTRNVWIKDFQPLSEIIKILKHEKYLTNEVKLLYYSMLKDAATLLSHKIVFSDEAKSTEIRRKKLTYDIKQILNNKDMFQKMQEDVRDIPSPDKKKRLDREMRKNQSSNKKQNRLDDTDEMIKEDTGLRPEWKNQIELNKIIYQGVASQNPVQVYTIIYNDVKDIFIYRLYRASDCSTYEKRLAGHDIMLSCAPNYQVMLRNKMSSQLGERIGNYYKTNMLVASLMSYYNLKK